MKGLKEKIFEVSTIGLTDIIGTGIAAIFWLYIASEVGPESYGEITFLISIASIISGISLFGSNDTILVLVSKKKRHSSTNLFNFINCKYNWFNSNFCIIC